MGKTGTTPATPRPHSPASLGENDEVRIGEAALIAGVSQSVLRRFEALAKPPVKPVRRLKPRGDRYYRVGDLRAFRASMEDEASR